MQKQKLRLTGFPGYVITTDPSNGQRKLRYLGGKTMMTSTGKLVARAKENGILKHLLIVTTEVNSRSPIYGEEKDKMICYGIQSDDGPEDCYYNLGTHLTKDIISRMDEWMASRPPFEE